VVSGMLGGGGGGGGHTVDPVLEEFMLASLAFILGARVPVGRPRGPIQIHVVCLYAVSSSSTTVTSTTLSSSLIPSSPSLIPGDDNTGCLCATGMGMGPYRGWRRAFPGDPTESQPGLRVPLSCRPVVQRRETEGVRITLTLRLGICFGAWHDGPTLGSPPVRRSRSRSRVTPGSGQW
jgi:hypothetical protein